MWARSIPRRLFPSFDRARHRGGEPFHRELLPSLPRLEGHRSVARRDPPAHPSQGSSARRRRRPRNRPRRRPDRLKPRRPAGGRCNRLTGRAGPGRSAGGSRYCSTAGVRGGADVFKALALGASAVCIGRPYAYGLAVGGSRGVSEVIRNLQADFELTMALSGRRSIAEIGPDAISKS